jgi:hypothetical protein
LALPGIRVFELNECPFLGLEEDPQTLVGFSSDRNFCYQTEKPTAILLEHQQKYCLTKNHSNCPVFQDISHLTLPIEKSHHNPAKLKRPISRGVWVAFVVFILTGILMVNWLYEPGLFALGKPASTLTVKPKNIIPLAETAPLLTVQSQPATTLEITSAPSPSPTPTETPTPISATSLPLELETPSGTTPRLLIHRIVLGENLSLLANRYGTSVTAIQSINYFLPIPLWVGLLVVIPLNTTDVSALPAFEPYQVKDDLLTLEDIAWVLNTNPELLSRYNLMDPKAVPPAKSWLLIPRPFPPPTGLPRSTPKSKK